MKRLYTILLFIAHFSAWAQYSINARDFGATPDDNTDDAAALNAALAAAADGKTLFIPKGIYHCNKRSGNHILFLDNPGSKRFKITGEPGTKITSNQATGALLYIYSHCEDSAIEDIFFENTHSIIQTQTNAIFLAGTPGTLIKNFSIRHCRFEGFSTAISGQGVRGWLIEKNYFAAPLGHDNAQDNKQPAVFLWFADNANGQCYDVKVLYNDVNGFTGTDITQTVTKRAMDGFVFGSVYGIQIEGNVLRNLGEEHIALAPNSYFPGLNYPVSISRNKIYMSLPSNAVPTGNFGIRIDCNNWSITDNDFFDYTQAVLAYPFDYPNLKQRNFSVTGNRFYAARSPGKDVREAIKIQGSTKSGNRAYNVVVANNTIFIDSIALKGNRTAIGIYDSEKVTVKDNSIFNGKIILNGFTFTPVLMERTQTVLNSGNEMR